jgi:hypothetical protein
VSEDPAQYETPSANNYVYATDSPTVFVDPLGMDRCDKSGQTANYLAALGALSGLLAEMAYGVGSAGALGLYALLGSISLAAGLGAAIAGGLCNKLGVEYSGAIEFAFGVGQLYRRLSQQSEPDPFAPWGNQIEPNIGPLSPGNGPTLPGVPGTTPFPIPGEWATAG